MSQRGKYEEQAKHGMRSSHVAGSMPRVCYSEQSSVSRRFLFTNSSRTDFLRRTALKSFSELYYAAILEAPHRPTSRAPRCQIGGRAQGNMLKSGRQGQTSDESIQSEAFPGFV